ncbi:MAG: CBS domain-containing protein [Candidatus Goldiibacteriota bacterium]
MVIITSHKNLDFDGLAAMVAASKLYENSVLYMPWNLNKPVKKFHTFYKYKFRLLKDRDIDFSRVEKVVIVDGMTRVISPALRKLIDGKKTEVIVYDHHNMDDRITGKNVKKIDITYGACTTYLVEELFERNIEITKEEAMLFMLGMYSDTGSFSYPNTTPADIKAAAKLMEMGVNMKAFSDFLRENFESAQIKLFNRLTANMQFYEAKGYKIIITYARFTEHIRQLSDVTGFIMSMNTADAIVSVVQMENKIFIVGRSLDENIDIRRVSEEFRGGGHKTAAAAVVPVKKGISIKSVKDKVYRSLMQGISEKYTAKDIMSSPVRAVSTDLTMEEAYRVCLRFDNNGLPAVKDGKLAGFITKADIEKGIRHNLGSIPVGGYMSTKVITIREDTPIVQAQHIMLENGIGHLPVVENEKLKGIVTRTDILEYLYREKPLKKERIIFVEEHLNMKNKMSEKLDKEIYVLIKKIGELADDFGVNVYLVGGIVRDLFLQEKDMDIDITVEGDGMKFAEFLADNFGGAYKGFERFKTAKVFLADGKRIDITSARAEFYEFPAALPEIEFTPIRYDLYRRDFTINAMAVQINKNVFGRFTDYFNGYRDLEEGVIRTLYNMSFIDDPTRIMRAVRFEQRLNFKIEENTLRFINETIKYNIFEGLSGERIRDEIFILLNEENPLKPMKRLQELNVLSKLSRQWKIDPVVEGYFRKIKRIAPGIKPLELYFTVLVYNLSEEAAGRLAGRLKLNTRCRRIMEHCKQDEKKVFAALHKKSVKNSRIYELLKKYDRETLWYFMAVCESEYVVNRIEMYIEKLRFVSIETTGRELKKMGIKPGPEYTEILSRITEAKLDGKLKTKKDELKFAEKTAGLKQKKK